MLTKESLTEIFAKDAKKYYEVDIFRQEGLTRKRCPICQKHFWSISKETCGDSTCEPYSFFREGSADYIETWKRFERFFVEEGHTSIPRYPVICRWRDDLNFTIASIVDFMRLEKGVVTFEYPANPLIVPQVCLRFNDIPLVGVTGRHMTSFTMAGQHTFGSEGYWKDRCLELNYNYLTGVLGVPKEELTYIEDIWAMPDLSSFGPCMESFAGGLELGNSVFMQFRKSGENDFKELDTKVIDVGWGFERLVWYAAGTPTAYDVAYGPVIGKLIDITGIEYNRELFRRYAKLSGRLGDDSFHGELGLKYTVENLAKELQVAPHNLEKSIAPIQAIYAIADHARTLLFAISDGGIPSNVGGGYNLRVVLRRALTAIEKNKFNFTLTDVAEEHAKYLRPMYPELAESLDEFSAAVDVETKRYDTTSVKARRVVADVISKGPIDKQRMMLFYESYGITPEFIKEVAEELGTTAEVPTGFYEDLTNKHLFQKAEAEKPIDLPQLPQTIALYYTSNDTEGSGKVLYVKGTSLVLDQTIFYPESGGQVADRGTIIASDEQQYQIKDIQKVGGVIIHFLDREPLLTQGDVVRLEVDKSRRQQLRQHHTATHIIAAAVRAVLGKHVWQAGARKDVDKAHLDITHYERITPAQLEEIESLANEIVEKDIKIDIREMSRGDAEAKFGFQLYQGGAPPGKVVRVIDIPGIDTELCGGTHLDSTSQAGVIKIIREERIQDGINRIEFAAGRAALEFIVKQERALGQAAATLSVTKEAVPKTVEKFFNEWKDRGKTVDKLVDVYLETLKGKDEVEQYLPLSQDILRTMASKIINSNKNAVVVLFNQENFLVCATGKDSPHNAAEIVKKLIERFGGSGGGSKTMATAKTVKPLKPR